MGANIVEVFGLIRTARTYGAAERSARYWSPRRYWTTGLTVRIAQRLWWGLEISLDGRGGYANEDEDGTAVPEMSWGADLGRDVGRGWRFAVGYHTGESARSGGYQSQIGTAELTYRFGTRGP